MLTHKKLKARALERPDVKAEYDKLGEEFSFLDEFLNNLKKGNEKEKAEAIHILDCLVGIDKKRDEEILEEEVEIEVGFDFSVIALSPSAIHRDKNNGSQNADNGDDHQKLNQCKT